MGVKLIYIRRRTYRVFSREYSRRDMVNQLKSLRRRCDMTAIDVRWEEFRIYVPPLASHYNWRIIIIIFTLFYCIATLLLLQLCVIFYIALCLLYHDNINKIILYIYYINQHVLLALTLAPTDYFKNIAIKSIAFFLCSFYIQEN